MKWNTLNPNPCTIILMFEDYDETGSEGVYLCESLYSDDTDQYSEKYFRVLRP